MEIIGHRGCGGQYPENTIYAVRQAAPHVDMVEIDVRQCRSGELVVIHDETLERVADVDVGVGETEWADLSEYTVLGTDQRIPLLSELLEAAPADLGILVELKERGIEAEALEAAQEVDNEVRIISFNPETLVAVAGLDEQVDVGLIFENDPEEALKTAVKLDCAFLHPHYEFCLDLRFVKLAHRAGLELHAGTLGTKKEAEMVVDQLTAAGVDCISVDRWDILGNLAISGEPTS